MPRKDVDPEAVYTPDEVRRIMTIARQQPPLTYALLAWCYEFGARTAEPGMQLLRDVDLPNNRARPVHLKGGATKAWHFLLPYCQEALPMWLRERPQQQPLPREQGFASCLFPSAFPGKCYICSGTGQRPKQMRLPNGKREKGPLMPCHHCSETGQRWGMDRREVYNVVAPVLRAAGVPKGRQHPHTLRHTIITQMLNSGVEPKVIQDRVGHRQLSTTLTYVKATDKARAEVVDKMKWLYNEDEDRS